MINLLPDGTITIEFPADPPGLVTIAVPKWGAYKRIRRERQKISDALTDKVAALKDLEPMPDAADTSDAAKAKRKKLAAAYRDRRRDVEDLAAEALIETWRFILCGNRDDGGAGPGDFDGLATPRPPDSEDEWPSELFVDLADLEIDGVGQVVRTNDPLLDAVHKHWGKVRFRSGATPDVT